MSAAKLEIEWKDTSNEQVASVPLNHATWQETKMPTPGAIRQFSNAGKPNHCPHCQSIIYSRKAKLCGVCSEPIPEAMRFNSAEERRVQTLLETERRRHRQWVSRSLRQTLAVL